MIIKTEIRGYVVAFLLILSWILLPSCSRDFGPETVGSSFKVTVSGGIQKTKAYVYQNDDSSTYGTMWEVGDSMTIWFDKLSSGESYSFVNDMALELCSFSGTVSEAAGSHTIYGCCPESAVVKGSETASAVQMILPVNQAPMWGASDGSADWLIMKPEQFTLSKSSCVLEDVSFARVNSIVKFLPTDKSTKSLLQGENITSVVLKLEGVPLAGKATVDLNDASVSGWTETADSVKASYGKYDYFTVNGSNATYFCVKPSAVTAGTTLTLKLVTTAHKAEKTVSAKAMEFRPGNISVINVSFSDADICEWTEPDPPTPGPDPEPVVSNLPKWPESPSTPEKMGSKTQDYYYTYHITDVDDASGNKARNYCCCYSREYMCPVWVAAPYHDFYAQKKCSRTDAYQTDPNFDFKQVGKWSGYTRGHMLGSAERLVSRLTNCQVFYWSNIAPQFQTYFNTGGGVWNDCEDLFCDPQWVGKKDTTYIVTGCLWDESKAAKYESGSRIPTHFYKILLRTKNHLNKNVCDCSASELQCIAVVLEHKAYSKSHFMYPSTYPDMGVLRTVKQMEDLTGFVFFPNVPNAPKDSYDFNDWKSGIK